MRNEGVSAELIEMLRRELCVAVAPADQEPNEKRTKPYKVAEVAAALGVHVSTIYRDIEAGRLSAIRVGVGRGTLRVEVDDFAEYRTLLKTGAVKKPTGGSAA